MLRRLKSIWAWAVKEHAPIPLLKAAAQLGFKLGGHEKLEPHFLEHYHQIDAWDRLNREALLAMQSEKLQHLAQHAYTHIPYYGRRWRELGITPDEIQSPADLEKLPILTREEVIEHAEELLDPRLDKKDLATTPTGGTTGAPVRVYRNRDGSMSRQGFFYRWTTWAGCDFLADPYVLALRPSFQLMEDRLRWGQRGEHYPGSYFSGGRVLQIAVTNLLPEVLGTYCRRIRSSGAVYFRGYPSAAHQLAQYLIDRSETLPLKAVLTSSECLYPDTRDLVRQAFECEVWDHYSCNEMSVSASECEAHSGLHVDMERCITEVVDPDGQSVWDEIGTVCGTDLDNEVMPLFRYCLNDHAQMTREACACGRGHLRITQIVAREGDYILRPDGVRVTPPTLRQTLNDLESIREFQIIQESATDIRVRIVPGAGFESDVIEKARTRVDGFLGGGMKIDVEVVDLIPRSTSGKFRLLVNTWKSEENQAL